MLKIGLAPLSSEMNVFVNRFAASLEGEGRSINNFSRSELILKGYSAVILHWPNEFFYPVMGKTKIKAWIDLILYLVARVLYGTRLVWVAHNVAPHDIEVTPKGCFETNLFMHLLSGVIYLSNASKAVVENEYPLLKKKKSLITRHGDYKSDVVLQPLPRKIDLNRRQRVLFYGMIRPYKNIEAIPKLACEIKEADWHILGMGIDKKLENDIYNIASTVPNLFVDIRNCAVPQADLDQAIDEADLIILPYKKILNSGAVMLALSRNKPVLAPRMGSLPDIQREVGAD